MGGANIWLGTGSRWVGRAGLTSQGTVVGGVSIVARSYSPREKELSFAFTMMPIFFRIFCGIFSFPISLEKEIHQSLKAEERNSQPTAVGCFSEAWGLKMLRFEY